MAAYRLEITAGKMVKTLTFLERRFQEVWEPDQGENWGSETILEQQVQEAFPYLEEAIMDIVEELTCFDEDEMADAMTELTNYEKRSSQKYCSDTIPAGGRDQEKEFL